MFALTNLPSSPPVKGTDDNVGSMIRQLTNGRHLHTVPPSHHLALTGWRRTLVRHDTDARSHSNSHVIPFAEAGVRFRRVSDPFGS
jgi:hypothetical protein